MTDHIKTIHDEDDTISPFGELLQGVMQERGLLGRDLARLIGMSPGYLSDIRRGNKNVPAWLIEIMPRFGVDLVTAQNAAALSVAHHRVDLTRLPHRHRAAIAEMLMGLEVVRKRPQIA